MCQLTPKTLTPKTRVDSPPAAGFDGGMKIFKRWLLSLAACIGIALIYSFVRVSLNRLSGLPMHGGQGELVVLAGMMVLFWWVTRTIVRGGADAFPKEEIAERDVTPGGAMNRSCEKPKQRKAVALVLVFVILVLAWAPAVLSLFEEKEEWPHVEIDNAAIETARVRNQEEAKRRNEERKRKERLLIVEKLLHLNPETQKRLDNPLSPQASPASKKPQSREPSTESGLRHANEILRSAQDDALDQSLKDMRETKFNKMTALFPKDSPKIKLQIKYPSSWQVREQIRPDILFKINHPEGCFPIMSRGVSFDGSSQSYFNLWARGIQDIDNGSTAPESLYSEVLPNGATKISAHRRTVDAQAALDLICEVTENVGGVEIFMVKRFFFIPYKGHLITLEASYGLPAEFDIPDDEIRERFFEVNKLYTVIFITAVFLDR